MEVIPKGWVRAKIPISKKYKPSTRAAIAQDIIDYIVERSKKGEGKDGKEFPKYSKSYKDSLDFKIAGKDAGDINLTLSGEMLESIEILADKSGEIVVGFEKGSDINDRAEGNILGSYGGTPKRSRARNFLDLSNAEIKKILARYPANDPDKTNQTTEEVLESGEAANRYLEEDEDDS